jgi:adenylate cyclase
MVKGLKKLADSLGVTSLAAVGVGFAVFLLVLGIQHTGASQKLELHAYDLLMSLRPAGPSRQSRVTLIAITDDDIERLQRYPVPDDVLADVLHRLAAYHPRAIGLDLYRDLPVPPGREALIETLNRQPEIVVVQTFGDASSPGVRAPRGLANPGQVGCNDIPRDADNVVRRGLLYLGYEDPPCRSLALRLALLYLAHEGLAEAPDSEHPENLRLGRTSLPPFEADDGGYVDADAKGYQVLFDFRVPVGSIKRHTLGEVLDGRLNGEDIEGRIVVIGADAESVKDEFHIPRPAWNEGHLKTVGATVHGLLADQLVRAALEGDGPIRTLPEGLEASWLLAWCLAGAAIGARNRALYVFVPVQWLGIVAGASAVHGLFLANVWMPLVPSSLGWLLSTTFMTAWVGNREKKERQVLMNLFGKHVDARIADEIWRQRANLMTGGKITPRKMVATVWFSDLAGFTEVAEKLEPDVFIGWLNEYLDAMTEVINQHGGVVIRFIGDAIMAGFGVPVPRDSEQEVARDALNAARCALAVQRALARLNEDWHARGLPVAGMRIGINTGLLLAGSLGNRERLEYTIHGDTVNIAARLESYGKDQFKPDYFESPCRILISEATDRYLGVDFRRDFLGSVELKGKKNTAGVFELNGG